MKRDQGYVYPVHLFGVPVKFCVSTEYRLSLQPPSRGENRGRIETLTAGDCAYWLNSVSKILVYKGAESWLYK